MIFLQIILLSAVHIWFSYIHIFKNLSVEQLIVRGKEAWSALLADSNFLTTLEHNAVSPTGQRRPGIPFKGKFQGFVQRGYPDADPNEGCNYTHSY